MSWSRGAVVILKSGDQEIGDALENALVVRRATDEDLKQFEKALMERKLTKIHDTRFTNFMIEDLEYRYGKIKKPIPKWLDKLLSPFTLMLYWVSLFTDKYLVIKG